MSQENLALIFNEVPTTFPEPGKHLVVKDIGYDTSAALPPDSLSLQILYVSLDPYQRERMRDPNAKASFPAFELGKALTNVGLARVLKSTSEDFAEEDIISGFMPFQQYATLPVETSSVLGSIGATTKIPVDKGPDDMRHWLGALGMPGLTAYSSFYEIGRPQKGETIYISSAAGAVGQMLGQLAKKEGLTVIGSVGSDEKLAFLIDELGFDGGFNYKKEKPGEALSRLAPDGLDIYFENVGGEQLEAAIDNLKHRGRIIVCGMVSQYNLEPDERYRVRNLDLILWKALQIQGFLVAEENFGPKYRDEHWESMGKWLKDGTFQAKINETDGIRNGAEGFIGMLKGENFGKAVLKM